MGTYSTLTLVVFGLFTFFEIYIFFKEKKKNRTALVQTLGTIWTLWFAVFAIEQSRDDVKDTKTQIDLQKKQFEVQIEPILKAIIITYKSENIRIDSFAIQLFNDGTNDIYDIRVNKEMYFCDANSSVLSGEGEKVVGYDYEFQTLRSGDKIIIPIAKEDIERWRDKRMFEVNNRNINKNNLYLVFITKLYYRRAIDRKDYTMTKYFVIHFRSGSDDMFSIMDIESDNFMYKECLDKIIEFETGF